MKATFLRSSDVLWRRVAGEVLVADPDGTDVSSLSPSVSAAWLLLEQPRTREEVTDELVERFGVSADQIAGDVDRLLGELVERGWVVRTVGGG